MFCSIDEARTIAARAVVAAGAAEAVAHSLARATVAAEQSGRNGVGFAHLPDYLASIVDGRIDGNAQPLIGFPTPASIHVDAAAGIAQLGFDLAFQELVDRASRFGIAIFLQHNSYPAGELGYYTRRLAGSGLLSFAATNGPALMGAGDARQPVYGTNPFSFAAPVENRPALVIDQATSATAFVNLRLAAERGDQIPEGWAVDAAGQATTDARAALDGLLLAFGGKRGANIALMVEVLAAGMSGANRSIDAPSFSDGNRSPAAGLFIVAMAPEVLAHGLPARLAAQLDRLAALGIHIPGRGPAVHRVEVPASIARAAGLGAE